MDWIRQGLGRHAQNLGVYPESGKKVLVCLNQEDDTIRFSFSTKITLTILGFESGKSRYLQTSEESWLCSRQEMMVSWEWKEVD